MARPKKEGLDYFPVDVDFDQKMEALELMHGNDGLAWIIKFWQIAYKSDTGEVDLSGLFGELLAKKARVTVEKQEKILSLCSSVNLLYQTDNNKWTSNGIKTRIEAVLRERTAARERKERTHKTEEQDKVQQQRFTPPTIDQVKQYCEERKNDVDYIKWVDFYSAKNWMIGKNKMKDWKAAVRTWESSDQKTKRKPYKGS
jgi:hypothetical protein